MQDMTTRRLAAIAGAVALACAGVAGADGQAPARAAPRQIQEGGLFMTGHRWQAHCSDTASGKDLGVVYAPMQTSLAAACGKLAAQPVTTEDRVIRCIPGFEQQCVYEPAAVVGRRDPHVPYESEPNKATVAAGKQNLRWRGLKLRAPAGDYLRLGEVALSLTRSGEGYVVDYRIGGYRPLCPLKATGEEPVALLVHLNDGAPNSYFRLHDFPAGADALPGPVRGSVTIGYGEPVSSARLVLRGYCAPN
jgi:hypothetical protein